MDGVGAANAAANQIAGLKGVAQSNSAFNAEQAKLQREWSEAQSAKAMEFNSREAAKNRDWNKIIDRAMAADFSWNVSAQKYQEMYDWLIGR